MWPIFVSLRIGAARQQVGQARDDVRLVQDRQPGDVARETVGQRAKALAIKAGVFGGEADDVAQIMALLVQQLLAGQRLGGEQCVEPGVALRALAAMQPVLQRSAKLRLPGRAVGRITDDRCEQIGAPARPACGRIDAQVAGRIRPEIARDVGGEGREIGNGRGMLRRAVPPAGGIVQQLVEYLQAVDNGALPAVVLFQQFGAHGIERVRRQVGAGEVANRLLARQALDGKQHHVAIELALELAADVDDRRDHLRCGRDAGAELGLAAAFQRAFVQHRQIGGDEARPDFGLNDAPERRPGHAQPQRCERGEIFQRWRTENVVALIDGARRLHAAQQIGGLVIGNAGRMLAVEEAVQPRGEMRAAIRLAVRAGERAAIAVGGRRLL